MDRSAAPQRTTICATIKLGCQFINAASARDIGIVGPMMGIDHIALTKRRTHTDRNGLLASAEMRRRAHLLFRVTACQRLLGHSHAQQSAMQIDHLFGAWRGWGVATGRSSSSKMYIGQRNPLKRNGSY